KLTSGIAATAAAKFANNTLDVYRVQQRLKFYGFPDANGNPIVVDGSIGTHTIEAIKLFQAVVKSGGTSSEEPGAQQGKIDKTGATWKWLNSVNAPQWVQVASDATLVVSGSADYATSWVQTNVMNAALIVALDNTSYPSGFVPEVSALSNKGYSTTTGFAHS